MHKNRNLFPDDFSARLTIFELCQLHNFVTRAFISTIMRKIAHANLNACVTSL
jgi:hypothetical protein